MNYEQIYFTYLYNARNESVEWGLERINDFSIIPYVGNKFGNRAIFTTDRVGLEDITVHEIKIMYCNVIILQMIIC